MYLGCIRQFGLKICFFLSFIWYFPLFFLEQGFDMVILTQNALSTNSSKNYNFNRLYSSHEKLFGQLFEYLTVQDCIRHNMFNCSSPSLYISSLLELTHLPLPRWSREGQIKVKSQFRRPLSHIPSSNVRQRKWKNSLKLIFHTLGSSGSTQ